MRRFEKLTMTMTIAEALNLCKAIYFFEISCSKARVGYPEGEKDADPERMEILGVTEKEVKRMQEMREWLTEEAVLLEQQNEEA